MKFAALLYLLTSFSPALARKRPLADAHLLTVVSVSSALDSTEAPPDTNATAKVPADPPGGGIAAGAAQEPSQNASLDNNGQPRFVIDRIEFIGNRRIRSDTLKARIFSREGDVYNEDTLRRDFQALWNTQFFEDVKLRVEDSADRANGKIIIFDVKERPVIRRIR